VGAASQAEAEQVETALATTDAQVRATEAQLREQRVQLGYYTVSAPTAGVVGDIPVRVGDRVTTSTVLTTIDQNRGLELYIAVPVREASRLEVGLPVHLVDDAGQVFATEKLSFVSPSVDAATQSVLAKATLGTTGGLRTEQFVRARIVWSQEPSLTVPLVAVNRLGGQYFAFVAEDGDKGTVARQRAVDLGKVVGNDYLLKSGLESGERLIVSGVQRVRDGAPVSIVTGAEAQAGTGAEGR
jgi:RND family efflux transporter MFP subunit